MSVKINGGGQLTGLATSGIPSADSVGFLQAGTGASARTVQAKLRDVVSVKDFGAVGDGVTDDTAAIQAAAVSSNSVNLYFPYGLYKISDTIDLRNCSKIDFGGSTIKATSAVFNKNALYAAYKKASYTGFTPFSVTAKETTISLDSSISVEVNDLVIFKSTSIFRSDPDSNHYYHGMCARVLDVSGTDIIIDQPIYETFSVTDVEIWRGHSGGVEIKNGVIDISDTPPGPQSTTALTVRGYNIKVSGVTFIGNDYVGSGLVIDGNNAIVENCAFNHFFNIDGLVGGGRTGYGVAMLASNGIVRGCSGYQCKHAFTAGPRDKVQVNLLFDRCNSVETEDVSSNYGGNIDIHCGATGDLVISDCVVQGHYTLLNLRARGIKVIGGIYTNMFSGRTINSYEQGFYDIKIKGVTFIGSGSNTLFYLSPTLPNVDAISGVSIDGCSLTGFSSVIQESLNGATLENIEIRNCEVSVTNFVNIENVSATNLVIDSNISAITRTFFRYAAPHTSIITDLFITNNKITQSGITNSSVIQIFPKDNIRFDASSGLYIDNNVLDCSTASGTGYAVSINLINVTGFSLSSNIIKHSTFRSVGFNSSSIAKGKICNNFIETQLNFFDSIAASTLNVFSVFGNTGDAYVVASSNFGYTKTQYVATSTTNNFVTFTS